MEWIDGSELQIGYCAACGQARQYQTSGGVMQEHLDEWATEECKCEIGKMDRQMKQSHEKAIKNIDNLFGTDFPETAAVLKVRCHILSGMTLKA